MIRRIKYRWTAELFRHDDQMDFEDMRRACPCFFATAHGKRESFIPYRGFLIVRSTRTYSNEVTERVTVLYVFIPGEGEVRADLLYVDHTDRIASAKRMADQVLTTRRMDRNGRDRT